MFLDSHHHSRGFTLIELLVVIAIIGVLSSVILVSLNKARSKGEDAARISDVKSLKTAMELYYNDSDSYPKVGVKNRGSYLKLLNNTGLSSYLTPKYISVIPKNLLSDKDEYVWRPTNLSPSSPSNSYGLEVYTVASGWCKTGVNMNPLWWGSLVQCNF